MRKSLTISAVGHAAVLLGGLIWISVRPYQTAPTDSLPVDIISAAEFSQLTAGSKTAPKAETPKPLVEKIADAKPVDDPAAKVADNKPEIMTASAVPVPVPAPEKTPDLKPPAFAPETPPAPAPKDAKKADAKPDPIADVLKKDDARKPEPKKEAKVPTPPKKPPQPKFDAGRIAALLDKRDPQRRAATGEALNPAPTLGAGVSNAPRLSMSEIDALRARIQSCWNVPAGAADAKDLIVQVRILMKPDGALQAEPMLINHSSNPYFQVAAEAALRAVRRCAPYSFLPVAKYEAWKDVEVTFDPRDMYRG